MGISGMQKYIKESKTILQSINYREEIEKWKM